VAVDQGLEGSLVVVPDEPLQEFGVGDLLWL
jgi:hypothetical protein